MTTLLIGSSGFIGRNILAKFRLKGLEIIGASRSPCATDEEFLDLVNRFWLVELLTKFKPSAVIFAIGSSSNASRTVSPRDWNSLQLAIQEAAPLLSECKKVLHTGSAAEYGRSQDNFTEEDEPNPIDEYGKLKLQEGAFFLSMRQLGVPSTVVRMSSIYGPGQKGEMLIPRAMQSVRDGTTMSVRNPLARRDYLYIEDVADAFMHLIQHNQSLPEVLNLASGSVKEVRAVLQMLAIALLSNGKKLEINFTEQDSGSPDSLMLSTSKFKDLLQWHPRTSLEEGLAHVAQE